jgi:hypothetical protein
MDQEARGHDLISMTVAAKVHIKTRYMVRKHFQRPKDDSYDFKIYLLQEKKQATGHAPVILQLRSIYTS